MSIAYPSHSSRLSMDCNLVYKRTKFGHDLLQCNICDLELKLLKSTSINYSFITKHMVYGYICSLRCTHVGSTTQIFFHFKTVMITPRAVVLPLR